MYEKLRLQKQKDTFLLPYVAQHRQSYLYQQNFVLFIVVILNFSQNMAGNPTTKAQRIRNEAQNPTNFLQKVFNDISLEKDEKMWMSTDDSLTEKRLRLIASFSETQFAAQLKLDCVSNAKNGKLSSALREKGNLCYAQGDCEAALRLYNQVNFSVP